MGKRVIFSLVGLVLGLVALSSCQTTQHSYNTREGQLKLYHYNHVPYEGFRSAKADKKLRDYKKPKRQ
ncbi:MAG: hypothetical protein AAFX87_01350 [Bacteroidota bacterium]